MVVKIANHDFSHDIVVGSYSANKSDVFESWTDANGVTHRVVVRSKVSASFNLYLRNDSRVAEFQTALLSKLSGGYYICQLQMNDSNEVYTGNFYLSYQTVRDTIGARDGLKEFTLTLEER